MHLAVLLFLLCYFQFVFQTFSSHLWRWWIAWWKGENIWSNIKTFNYCPFPPISTDKLIGCNNGIGHTWQLAPKKKSHTSNLSAIVISQPGCWVGPHILKLLRLRNIGFDIPPNDLLIYWPIDSAVCTKCRESFLKRKVFWPDSLKIEFLWKK